MWVAWGMLWSFTVKILPLKAIYTLPPAVLHYACPFFWLKTPYAILGFFSSLDFQCSVRAALKQLYDSTQSTIM